MAPSSPTATPFTATVSGPVSARGLVTSRQPPSLSAGAARPSTEASQPWQPTRPAATKPRAPDRRSQPPPQPAPPQTQPQPQPQPQLQAPTVMTTFPAHLRPAVLSNGLLLVDKPVGWEVSEVTAAVQRATRAAKVASVAPLDPEASGLVLLCFGAATRLAGAVERAVKVYDGSMVLGGAALSADVRGESFRPGWMPWGHITGDDELQEAADSLLLTAASSGAAARTAVEAAASGCPPTTSSSTSATTSGITVRSSSSSSSSSATTVSSSSGGDGSSGSESGAWSAGGGTDTGPSGLGDFGDSGGRGGGRPAAAGGVLQVLPPRHKLKQLPGSNSFVEEDAGSSTCTSPLQVRSFRVWTDPEDLSPARTTNTRNAPTPRSALGRGQPESAELGNNLGANPSGRRGRTVRFSVALAGRIQVRSLVAMYGRRLRTTACLDELRRTAIGGLGVEDAWALESLLPLLQQYQR